MKTYSNRSNAARAAKKATGGDEGSFEVYKVGDVWTWREIDADTPDLDEATADGAVDVQGTVQLTEEAFDGLDPEDGKLSPLVEADFAKLEETVLAQADGPNTVFSAEFNWHRNTAKLSKCASLRSIAHGWEGRGFTRKQFVAAAEAAGIKANTAGANWAAMKRGEA